MPDVMGDTPSKKFLFSLISSQKDLQKVLETIQIIIPMANNCFEFYFI